MITAMVKLPDGNVINKILSKEADTMLEALLEERIVQFKDGTVGLNFDDMRIITHWSNIALISRDSQ